MSSLFSSSPCFQQTELILSKEDDKSITAVQEDERHPQEQLEAIRSCVTTIVLHLNHSSSSAGTSSKDGDDSDKNNAKDAAIDTHSPSNNENSKTGCHIVNLVQDNALTHVNHTTAAMMMWVHNDSRRSSILAKSEIRWSTETSSPTTTNTNKGHHHVPAETAGGPTATSSGSNNNTKLRCPRRRLSMDCAVDAMDDHYSNNHQNQHQQEQQDKAKLPPPFPRRQGTAEIMDANRPPPCPRRRGTMEFGGPSDTSDDDDKAISSPEHQKQKIHHPSDATVCNLPPPCPQRKCSMDGSVVTTPSHRAGKQEVATLPSSSNNGHILGCPKPPQRRDSTDSTASFAPTVKIANYHHPNGILKSSTPNASRNTSASDENRGGGEMDRMAQAPRRRGSLDSTTCMSSLSTIDSTFLARSSSLPNVYNNNGVHSRLHQEPDTTEDTKREYLKWF